MPWARILAPFCWLARPGKMRVKVVTRLSLFPDLNWSRHGTQMVVVPVGKGSTFILGQRSRHLARMLRTWILLIGNYFNDLTLEKYDQNWPAIFRLNSSPNKSAQEGIKTNGR